MTDYEAWRENIEEDYAEMQFELSIHRCPKCNSMMKRMRERYDLTLPFSDEWWECLQCGYTEDI